MTSNQSAPFLTAVQHVRDFTDSAMQAQLYNCSDGYQYVLKLLGNKQGRRCIANDVIATHLAAQLGLPVFPSAFVHVPPNLLPDPALYSKARNLKSGMAWGTRFNGNVYHPEAGKDLENLSNAHLIPLLIAFDHWILNWDRASKMKNLLITEQNGRTDWYLIDHGIAFAAPKFLKGSLRWNLGMLQQHKKFTNYSYRGILYDKLVSYVRGSNPLDTSIQQICSITLEEIITLMNDLPSSWSISLKEKKAFAAALTTRAQYLPDILLNSKDYYPDWQ